MIVMDNVFNHLLQELSSDDFNFLQTFCRRFEDMHEEDFELLVFLSVEHGDVTQQRCLENVAKYMNADIAILNKRIIDEKTYATVTHIRLLKSNIRIGFKIESLENFYNLVQRCDDGQLSEALTKYGFLNNLEVQAGLRLGQMLKFHVEMDQNVLLSGLKFFGKAIDTTEGSFEEDHHSEAPECTANTGIAASNVDSDKILQKKVILVQPTRSSRKYVRGVSLKVFETTYEMKREYKGTKPTYIWSCFINVPFEKLERNVSFSLKAEGTSSMRLTLGIFKIPFEWHSKPYFLTDATVERLVWNSFSPEPWCVAEHFKDIILNWFPVSSLAECCMQVESFSKYMKLNKQDAIEVRNLVLNSVEETSAEHWLLLAVVIANIFKSPQTAVDNLGEKEITTILKVLNKFRIHELTTSLGQYLPLYLMEICKKAQGDSYCFVLFVDAVYPFMDEELLYAKLLDVVKEKAKIVPDRLEQYKGNVLSAVRRTCNWTKSNVSLKFLEKLLPEFPVTLAVETFLYLKTNNCLSSTGASEIVFETVKESLKKYAKCHKTISGLVEVWTDIESVQDLSKDITPDFESAFIRSLENATGKDTEKLIQVLLHPNLFSSAAGKTDIIKCLANSRRHELHSVLFTIIMDLKFKDASVNFSEKLFNLCIENGISELNRSGSLEQKLKCVYRYFTMANEVPMIRSSETLQNVLTTIAVKFLRQFPLKDLMRSTKFIEELSANSHSVLELFRDHLKAVLSYQQQNDYYEILYSLCSTGGDIRINSRFTAEIVCTILEIAGVDKELSVTTGFTEILKQYNMWMAVFKTHGTHSYQVKMTDSYKTFIFYVESMHKLLKNNDIQNELLGSLAKIKGKDKVINLLCSVTNEPQKNVNKLWSDIENCFSQVLKNLTESISVLKAIQSHMSNIPSDIKVVRQRLEQLEKDITNGHLTAKKLTDKTNFGDLEELLDNCTILFNYVKSKIFWTSCKQLVDQKFEHERTMIRESAVEMEPFESSIYMLFENQEADAVDNEDDDRDYPETVLLLQILTGDGIREYKSAWTSLIEDQNKHVSFALRLIQGVSIDEEIKSAEQILNERIPPLVKVTLQRLIQIRKYKDTIDSLKRCLSIFKIGVDESDSLFSAISAFEMILSSTDKDCPFSVVVNSLEKVDTVSKLLSSESQEILSELSHSSLLVDFLKEIVEEDIRNLIDAVDCISEQQVQATTVSALIDVKGFLQGILKKSTQGLSAHDFTVSLNKQTQTLSENAKKQLPSKIHDCRNSLHNLKSLYGNVANRGEMTIEIIKNITSKGKFTFKLNKRFCSFHVTYRRSTGKGKEKHTKASLMDLRSRALLLMNTSAKPHTRKISSELLKAFVQHVDISLEISEIISQLHQSGNIEFTLYEESTDCQDLQKLKKTLLQRKNEWDDILKTLREKYYLLNYIHGPEIHLLYIFLERNIGKEKVSTILRFIHPGIEIDGLFANYRNRKSIESDWTLQKVMECICDILHLGYTGKKPIQRPFQAKAQPKRMTDVVQNRKIYVAALDENSSQVINTLLALYLHTTHVLPEAHQVSFCSKETTWNELELLLYRCLGASSFTDIPQLFCIAYVENLVNEVQFKLVEALKNIKNYKDYLLALIYRGSSTLPFLDEMSSFTSKTSLNLSDEALRQVFHSECPCAVTITSNVPGLGKTNKIKEYAFANRKSLYTLHVSGPVHKRSIIDKMKIVNITKEHALHLDIGAVDNPAELDTFLFELIILGYVTAGFCAVSLETEHVYIEIANTINDSLRDSLSTAMFFHRKHLIWNNYNDFRVSMEINSPVQVVCHYLSGIESGSLDKRDIRFTGTTAENCLPETTCRTLLRNHFGTDSELSFSVVNIFLQVLADQLKKMSCSAFLRVSQVSDMMGHKTLPTVRSTFVKALIESSKEFSSRSIAACRSKQITATGINTENVNENPTKTPSKMEFEELVKKRVEGMIRWEDSNHMIFVFHNQNIQTLSLLYRDLQMVPSHIKTLFESQLKRQMQDFTQMEQVQLQSLLQKVSRTRLQPLSNTQLHELSSEYALTPDNLLKMILIMLRVKARIPVVLMGETGCGKTSLIRYLAAFSDVDFEVMSIHAGVEENDIIEDIQRNNKSAFSNPNKERWLFLDEINTSEHIGLISAAMCSRTFLNKFLAPNLVIMCACNPYKLRSETAVCTAGLTEKLKTDALSKLVYRVLPLPERLVDYVWDFGSLSDSDEAVYIQRMISGIFGSYEYLEKLLREVLSKSQKFVRDTEDSSYSVSLRDIQRSKTLIRWFQKIEKLKGTSCTNEIKCIVLALSVCYHSRFSKNSQREAYRLELEQVFTTNGYPEMTQSNIQDIIIKEQKDILNRMDLPPGTAKNTALQENVFVILVCLLNRIPIFLVGKPGCSKSLSMQVIRSNLRGKDSKDPFFMQLPQLYCVSFQGSESSTSEGINKVFEKAEKYQVSNAKEDVLSVVILDEIGLAEVSKFNPLKVLHNLLEPGGQPQPNVAVVGISNWALDASKMNRGIHLSRPDMDIEELYQTGVSISESFLDTRREKGPWSSDLRMNDELTDIKRILKGIADSYLRYITTLRFKNFHGLRDFYSLVKFVSQKLLEEQEENTVIGEMAREKILLEGIRRNFGGLPAEETALIKSFKIDLNYEKSNEANVLKLMKDNIEDKTARHLMCITSGESTLSLIERLLNDINRDEKVVIFGSQFEEDQTPDYDYRILSRIILCMEQGLVLVLKDLDNIYGSLYDMLNQNYTVIGKKKHCRIALSHYSNPLCQVHNGFRCIVLVDEGKVDLSDPPFLNRFEKQSLKFTAVMNHDDLSLIETVQNYIEHFCAVDKGGFDIQYCFPLYSQDLVPSLVFSSRQAGYGRSDLSQEQCLEECKIKLLFVVQADAIFRLGCGAFKDIRKEAQLKKTQFLKLPIHSGLWNFIDAQLSKDNYKDKNLLTIVLTNSSIHSNLYKSERDYEVQVEYLGAFKSEKQLTIRLQDFWSSSQATILFLHCSAIEDEKHIFLAKTTIENTRTQAIKDKPCIHKHVYMILHIDRQRTERTNVLPVNFLSGWELVLLDTLEKPEVPLPQLCKMSLYQAVLMKMPLKTYITEQLFWSFTTIRYQKNGRDIESIHRIIERIKASDDLLQILEDLICKCVVEEFDKLNELNWHERIALNGFALNTSSAYMYALEDAIYGAIKVPLAKLIYQMENINALSSYFYEQNNSQRMNTWKAMIHDKSLFSVTCVPSYTGPECYVCTASDFTLCMPLSKIVFDKIEESKDTFMESFLFVKGKCDVVDNEEMPEQVMEELFAQHESVIRENLPELKDLMYDGFKYDYFKDFANMISFSVAPTIQYRLRSKIAQLAISHKINLHTDSVEELLAKLHATVWIYSSVLSAELQMLDTCSEVFCVEENIAELLNTIPEKLHNFFPHVDKFYGYFPTKSYVQGVEDLSSSEAKNHFSSQKTVYKVDDEFECEETVSEDTMNLECHQGICKTEDLQKVATKLESNCDEFLLDPQNALEDKPASNSLLYSSIKQSDMNSERENEVLEMKTNGQADLDSISLGSFSDETSAGCKDVAMQLMELVCSKMIPTQPCLSLFKSAAGWNSKVSIILAFALQVSSESPALHCLRFFQDLLNILQFHSKDPNLDVFYRLADILQSNVNQKLDAPEFFECLCELLFSGQVSSCCENQRIMASYLNRCLACDAETRSVINFLYLIEERIIEIKCFVELKPPIHLAMNLELQVTEDEPDNVYSMLVRDADDILEGHPFLSALDQTLRSFKGTSDVDSELAVLVVDILEETFESVLTVQADEETDLERIRSDFLSAHKIILECDYGLKFVTAVAYFKSFMKYFGDKLTENNFDIMQCSRYFDEVRAVFSKEEDMGISVSLRNFVFKSFGKGLMPWKLHTICKGIHEKLEFFKCPVWTVFYQNFSVEGNPLFQLVPADTRNISEASCGKDMERLEAAVTEMLKKPVKASSTLTIQSLALSLFYIPRCHTRQDDTKNLVAERIVQIATDVAMDEANKTLLACLLGVESFPYPNLNVHEDSSEIDSCIAFFCCSLFSLILASNQTSAGGQLPFLAKCILCPLQLRAEVLHVVGNLTSQKTSKQRKVIEKLLMCSCGHRVFNDLVSDGEGCQCPVCSNEFGGSATQSGACQSTQLKTGKTLASHSFAPAVGELIRLFLNACLFGSLALKNVTTEEIKSILHLSDASKVSDSLMQILSNTFKDLQAMMGMNYRDLYVFLQACVVKLKDLIAEENAPVETTEQAIVWSLRFENEIYTMIQQRYQTVSEMVMAQIEHSKLPKDAAELCVNENDTANMLTIGTRTDTMPSIFRLQGHPSLKTLRFELDMVCKDSAAEDYPFLTFVLDMLPELSVTQNLIPIVQWHLATATYISYRFKKQECLEMTVQDFIYHDSCEKVRSILKNRFDNLQKSFSMLLDAKYKLTTPVERLHDQMKMKDCLMINSQTTLYKVIEELVMIQNNFLDTALVINSSSNCQSLKCLSRGKRSSVVPARPIAEINPASVVSCQWDEDLLKFSHSDLAYGCGQHIRYEFAAIEKSLALDLIIGKYYLVLDNSLPSVVFMDEFYKGFSKLVQDVAAAVPQKELSTDAVNGLKAKRNKQPRLTADLMTHIGVLITLVKKTKGDPDQSLIEYVDHWKNYLTHPLPQELLPAPEDSLKLCHLVALYGILEELNADSLVESLSDEFRVHLHRDIEIRLVELLQSNKKDAETILKATKRFTYRCVPSGEVDNSRPLSEYLEDKSFWPLSQELEGNLLELIPCDLKVHHIYHMIFLMDQTLKELTDREVKLTHIASFRTATTVTKAEKKKKMATKRRV